VDLRPCDVIQAILRLKPARVQLLSTTKNELYQKVLLIECDAPVPHTGQMESPVPDEPEVCGRGHSETAIIEWRPGQRIVRKSWSLERQSFAGIHFDAAVVVVEVKQIADDITRVRS
jgi:hypothetical protein